MKFIPFKDKVVIKPLQKKNVIVSESNDLIEAGEVIAVGESVDFLKVGDTVYFDSWGCGKTPDKGDGVQYYVVSVNEQVILGKEEYEQQSV